MLVSGAGREQRGQAEGNLLPVAGFHPDQPEKHGREEKKVDVLPQFGP